MSTGFSIPKWQGASLWRAASVFALVLLLHVWALYVFSRGLSAVVPADATQTTLSVALLAPPPAPTQSAQPTNPAPRPRARNAPTITAPVEAAPAPAPSPVETPVEAPPAPPAPVAADPPAAASTAQQDLALGAQALPTKGRIVYRTSYTRLTGITALTYVDWSIDPEKATYELWLRTVDPAGLLDLRSNGTLKSFGIAPDNYIEKIEIANRELRADFDWKMSAVSFVGRGASQPTTFAEGTQDPLSLQFHLPLLAQAYPWRFSPGSEVTFAVARRNVENYSFVVDGFETTRIDDTDVMTLKLDRKRGPNANRRVEIWMAPEFQWLPVRLRFTDSNDEVWDSVLSQLPSEPPPRDRIVQEPVKP
ncbi:MAG TPA: DUF3108 domain-containing protein [Burkholderiaceae bacterium]|jgi:hypothetical protein|nr:DUF3108 domain-containing protein [Burkholderiaceae bacterium]